jgi:hypothetical protein
MSRPAEQFHHLLDQVLSQEVSNLTRTALSFHQHQQTRNNVRESSNHLNRSLSTGENNTPTRNLIITHHHHPKTIRRRKSMMQTNTRRRKRRRKKNPKRRMKRKRKKTMMMTNFSGNSSSSKLGEGSQMVVRPKANLFQLKSGHRTLRSRHPRNVGTKDGTDYLTSGVV